MHQISKTRSHRLACRYDNTNTQEEFLKLGAMFEIISILKSIKLSKHEVSPTQLVDASGPGSNSDSDDSGFYCGALARVHALV